MCSLMVIPACIYRYRLYRDPTPDEDDVAKLTEMGKALLKNLKRIFPFEPSSRLRWDVIPGGPCVATKRSIQFCTPQGPWFAWAGPKTFLVR